MVRVPHTGKESSVPADFGPAGTSYRLVLLADQCIRLNAAAQSRPAAGRLRRRRIAAQPPRGEAAPGRRPDAPKAHFVRRSRRLLQLEMHASQCYEPFRLLDGQGTLTERISSLCSAVLSNAHKEPVVGGLGCGGCRFLELVGWIIAGIKIKMKDKTVAFSYPTF